MRTNNSKGFTLVELMVAAGLLSLAIAGAMSFFIYQSQKGADSTRLKVARENLTLALMLIQRDIMATGFGVMGSSVDPKTLTFVLKPNYGVDNVTSNSFSSVDTTQWLVKDLPHLTANVTDDPFLPVGSPRDNINFRPDKMHLSYGTFLDMNYDVNGTNDTNSVFKYSAIKNIGASAMPTFVYDLFPVEMAVTTDAKPVGGFICSTCGSSSGSDAGDINWQTTGSRTAGTKSWTVKLQSGMSPMMSSLSGNVAPSVVYRIAKDTQRPTDELQRNGVRIAGGDPGLEVYNLTVNDLSSGLKRSISIRIDYQVKLGGSNSEATAHGTAKKSWYKSYVTIEANPRVILLNGG